MNSKKKCGNGKVDASRRGRIVPELDDEHVREIFLYSYRFIYEISGDDIFILALVHGKRNISSSDILR